MSLIDDKWREIFDKLNVAEQINENGLFYITADQIREFKEPRLMTKFDTKKSLPEVFDNKYGILPVTRSKFVIGEFELHKKFPDSNINKMITHVKLPDYYESINVKDISSEAVAINVMGITPILDDFLGEERLVQTISGRMGSGEFDFKIGSKNNIHSISVKNSMIEIDGGFENRNIFTIIEGKNVVHEDFIIRQLYYPYRLWHNRLTKPVKTVFMVYSNNIFRLLEYEFLNICDYNSISLLREKYYSLEDIEIKLEDIEKIYKKVKIKPEPDVTFVQADSFDKVISLIEHLNEKALTLAEIAELFGFRIRQSDYYFNACKYLGLAYKKEDGDGIKRVYLSADGKRILKLPYKQRQLEYVRLILEHQIFNDIFKTANEAKRYPDKRVVINKMRELSLCSESLLSRRSSTVISWIRWIFNLTNVNAPVI